MSTEIDRPAPPTTASDGGSQPPTAAPSAASPATAEPVAALPSIIIDASLSSAPPGALDAAPAAFDPSAAEKFAAAFRPSWEPSLPAQAVSRSPLPPSTSQPPLGAAVVSSVDARDHAVGPQLAATRKRAMILIGASVVGFLVLAYLGVSSSSHTPNPEEAAEKPGPTTAPAQAAPVTTPQAPSAPEPSAAPAPAVAEPPPSAAAPVEPAAAPATDPVAEAPAPSVARLSVATEPPDAKLLLDGEPVANPFDGELALGSDHTLEAKAEGYATEQRSLRLAADARVTMTLAAEPPPPPAPKAVTPAKRKPVARPATKPKAAKPKRGAGFVADSPY